jgi:MFS transporter
VAFAGFLTMFFFVTLYMQEVLGFSPIQAGMAYLPVTGAFMISAGVSTQLIGRLGTRPVIVGGSLIAAAGIYWLSRVPVHGSYASDVLPGLLTMPLGAGAVFVGVTIAANAGVPAHEAGLAAALLNAARQVGSALALAIFSAIATGRTQHLLATHSPRAAALTAGYQRALLVSSIFVLAAAIIALRSSDTRGCGVVAHIRDEQCRYLRVWRSYACAMALQMLVEVGRLPAIWRLVATAIVNCREGSLQSSASNPPK